MIPSQSVPTWLGEWGLWYYIINPFMGRRVLERPISLLLLAASVWGLIWGSRWWGSYVVLGSLEVPPPAEEVGGQ